MKHQLCGLVIEINDLSQETHLTEQAEVDVRVGRLSPLKSVSLPSSWFMQWHLPGGEPWLLFAKMDSGYLLRFNGLADFFISDNGKKIAYLSDDETPPNTLRHLLLNQVIPLVINLRGSEALHASAVLAQGGTIAFIGSTGSGKSTLAGSFLCAEHPFVSDDCLAVSEKRGGIYAIPAYPGLRLWEDSLTWLFGNNRRFESVAHYTTKHQFPIEKKPKVFCSEQQPLNRIYLIAGPSEVGKDRHIIIEPLTHRDSFMALVKSTFRLDITDRTMLKRQFQFLERVVSCVSVRRLIFPRDFNLLPAVREAILKDLQDLDN